MNENGFLKSILGADEKDEMEELREEIREQVKLAIMVMEIYWEELEKSNLPDELKRVIVEGVKKNGGFH